MKLPNYLKLCLHFLVLGSTFATPSTPMSPPAPFVLNDYDDYPTTPPPPAAPCNTEDKITLLKIKQAFNTSDFLPTWIPNSDCCNGWDDLIKCDPVSGRVIFLYFQGNSPWGRQDLPTIFPSAIGNLSYLTTLIFINNATGPIPSFISNLRHLEYLDLSRNRLSGHIPQFITRFQNLSIFALNDNQLTGTIPPQLSQLPYLNLLSLENNKLTGPIPNGLFSLYKPAYSDGVYLLLGSNKLKGPIPRSLASVKIRRLELEDNKFSGDASFLFGKDKGLWYIDLSKNKLSFNMSELEVNSDIITLNLNNNKIFGSLPSSLVNVTMLSYFNVSYNLLCGQIPVGGRLQQFDSFAYSHNKCLCGNPLPQCTW